MRTCPYCGKGYPDEFSVCPTDQNILAGAEVIPRLDDFKKLPRKRGLKIVAAGLAHANATARAIDCPATSVELGLLDFQLSGVLIIDAG